MDNNAGMVKLLLKIPSDCLERSGVDKLCQISAGRKVVCPGKAKEGCVLFPFYLRVTLFYVVIDSVHVCAENRG